MKHQAGMTLFEVLVALAVFATAAVALVQAGSAHLNSLSYLEQKTFANWVASDRQAQVTLAKEWPKMGKSSGETEMAGNTWFWRQEVLETTDAQFRGVRVDVFENDKSTSPLVSLTSFQRKR